MIKELLINQANIPGIFVWLGLLVWILYRRKKDKAARMVLIGSIVLFYAVSTAWLPRYLAYRLEKQYPPLKEIPSFNGKKVYIHLLGSGYQKSDLLPATSKLCLVAQGRLTEALRLHRKIPQSILVCSADGPPGKPTQAMVAREAAIDLGADSSRIITLNTPTTTREEAQELRKIAGAGATVIIATDAMHMPRAVKFFQEEGLVTIAAPTNFKAIEGSEGVSLKWWPNEDNIYVMNRVLHEYLASFKSMFQ